MNVMLSMFSTIFFLPSASRPFTFSRRALLSSPNTMRPSSATTDTPSTSRFVIFNATFVSSYEIGAAAGSNLAEAAQLTSIVVRAGHVISADRADQLAAPGRQPLRANRAIPGSILVRRGGNIFRLPCDRIRFLATGRRLQRDRCIRPRWDPSIFRGNRSCPFFRGTFHGPKVIAQPNAGEKRVGRVGGWAEEAAVLLRPTPVESVTVPVVCGAVVVQEGWRKDPVIVAERYVLRPDLVERGAVVEDAAFHDEGDVGAVVDVVERVFVEDVEVGELAYGDGAEILIHAEIVGAVVGGHFERAHWAECGGVHPKLPVRIDALLLAVSAERAETAGIANISDGLGDEREAVVGFGAHHAAAGVWKDFAPRSPAQKFCVFVVVERLKEIFLVPDAGAAHDGRR